MKSSFHIAALLSLATFLGVPRTTAAQNPPPSRPDGIFTPTIAIVTSIDKTGRPMTVESRQLEPRLTASIVAGNPTGDSYVIHFSQGDAGGPCIYSGNARYLIEGDGTLTFQILADCGKLRRGYNYMICRLDTQFALHGSSMVEFPRSQLRHHEARCCRKQFRPRSLAGRNRSSAATSEYVREDQSVQRPPQPANVFQYGPWPRDFLPRVSSRIEVLPHLGIFNHLPHQKRMRRNAQPRFPARRRSG